MRLLANENIPADVVAALAAAGHDVVWVRDTAPGRTDDEVLAWAMHDRRVLLTFDKEFGELAWRRGLPATCGVILLRLPMPPPGRAATVISRRIAERDGWAGHVSVIEPERIRRRSLAGIGECRLMPGITGFSDSTLTFQPDSWVDTGPWQIAFLPPFAGWPAAWKDGHGRLRATG